MNELALFAGAGGGILGGHLLGWRCICAVEYDKYARDVLLARQRDGQLPRFPIWDDVRTFDGRPWRGVVNVVSGGFPCQDISSAGKGAGIEGARSGLWKEMARIIGEVRPRFAFVENSPMLVSRGLTTVLSDLAEMGYDAVWGIVSAADCGAPHLRKRIWIIGWNSDRVDASKKRFIPRRSIADTGCTLRESRNIERSNSQKATERSTKATEPERCSEDVANASSKRCREARHGSQRSTEWLGGSSHVLNTDCSRLEGQRQESSGAISQQRNFSKPSWWETEPDVGRVAHGVAHRVDRLRCIGNGQVPVVAATAWRELIKLAGINDE